MNGNDWCWALGFMQAGPREWGLTPETGMNRMEKNEMEGLESKWENAYSRGKNKK